MSSGKLNVRFVDGMDLHKHFGHLSKAAQLSVKSSYELSILLFYEFRAIIFRLTRCLCATFTTCLLPKHIVIEPNKGDSPCLEDQMMFM